jgi:hypothetical protein
MSGEFGLCGYFREFDRDLAPDERLQFVHGELPPPFDAASQPAPPAEQWSATRQAKASRNYAVDYIRNGLCELAAVIGNDEAVKLGGLAARLIGLQYYPATAALVQCRDGDLHDAADYLARKFAGMGDDVRIQAGGDQWHLLHNGLRVLRGRPAAERSRVLECWPQLWSGAMASQRQLKMLTWQEVPEGLRWSLRLRTAGGPT